MAKKDFTKHTSFFTDDVEQKQPEQAAAKTRTTRTAPEGYKVNPQFVEVKSKRVQLVFQPSIYDRAKAAATEQGISLNEYMHRLIDADTQ